MEREIKLRIIYKNKIIGYERLAKTGWEWMSTELNPDTGERWIAGVFPPTDNAIRNQYTGIKDKNGKEIFEGDIVKYAIEESWCKNKKCETKHKLGIDKFCPECGSKVTPEDFIRIAEIRYSNGGFCLYEEQHTDGEYTYTEWQTYIAESYIRWKEIIGNIYETTTPKQPLTGMYPLRTLREVI